MSLWRKWHKATIDEWKSSMCPCFIRFAEGWPKEKHKSLLSPAKVFPSFWVNVASLSDKERDFFVQCVEHIQYGVGMHITPPVEYTMNRFINESTVNNNNNNNNNSLEINSENTNTTITTICDIVLMPDGRPCMGWFLDRFEFHHYANVISALEERWCNSSSSLWLLKEHNITSQLDSMTSGNKQDIFFEESIEWIVERMNMITLRHVRFVDKYTPYNKESINGICRLSLSYLREPTESKYKFLLIYLNNFIISIQKMNENITGFPIFCHSFGCLIKSKINEKNNYDVQLHNLGRLICSLKCNDEFVQTYKQLIQDLLDIIEGKELKPYFNSIYSLYSNSVKNLLENLNNMDKILLWFPKVIALSQIAPTPKIRDDIIYSAILAIPSIENYITAYENSLLQQHVSFERPRPEDEDFAKGNIGLVDNLAFNKILTNESFITDYNLNEKANKSFLKNNFEVWMPGVGLDSSFYISNLLASCDTLAHMIGVPESFHSIQNDFQKSLYRLRHKLRVHTLRRFGFVTPSNIWKSSFSNRSLPFLNALQISLLPSTNIIVLRFRNGEIMPNSFDAINEPSLVLRSLSQFHLFSPGNSPCFCVECGTVQDLEKLAANSKVTTKLQCFFAPNNHGKNILLNFIIDNNVLSSLATLAISELRKGSEIRFVDVTAQLKDDRLVLNQSLLSAPSLLCKG